MFQMIGAGEKAGSGFPLILQAWREQHWREPNLQEFFDNERTELVLTLASLIPEAALDVLMDHFGEPSFKSLPETKRLALATALIEGQVTNRRLSELTDQHSRDITFLLGDLVDNGFLKSEGRGRGTYYTIPGRVPQPERLFDAASAPDRKPSTPDKGPSTPDKEPSTPDKEPSTPDKPNERIKQKQHREIHQDLLRVGKPIRNAGRSDPEKLRATILKLCEKRYLRIDQLVTYLGRKKSTLRDSYLNPMVRQGMLKLRYPDRLTHPKQAYKTAESD